MSEVKKHIGKLRQLTNTTEGTLEYIKKNGMENRFDFFYGEDGELEYFEPLDDKYRVLQIKGQQVLVELLEHKELDEWEDIMYHSKDSNGTIDFALEYYNGGTCLDECLEDILETYIEP